MGVGERASDDEVELVHGLRGKPPAAVGVQERVVERFDLLVAQPADAGPAEGREDVAPDVAFIAPVGAGGEVQLLGRQPLAGEVGAEGE